MPENPYESPPSVEESVSPEPRTIVQPELGTRLASSIIDGLFRNVILIPIVVATQYFDRLRKDQIETQEMLAFTIGGLFVFLCLHGYLLATRGQTIGKLLTKIQIVDNNSNTLLPFFRVLVLRYMWLTPFAALYVLIPGRSAQTLIVVLNFVNIILIFGNDRRCLHDYMAASKVVEYVSTRSRAHDGIDRQPPNEMPYELTRIEKRILFLEKMTSSNGPDESDLRKLEMIDSTVESYLSKTNDLINSFETVNQELAHSETIKKFRTRVNRFLNLDACRSDPTE